MSTKITEHESELAKAKASLDDVVTRRRALAAEEEELASVVKGWEAIVARERRELAGAAFAAPRLSASDSTAASDSAMPQIAQEDEEEGENKTQFVRDQIRRQAAIGTKPDDLKKAAKAAGLQHPTSWPYGPLQRLKKRGEIIKRKGKYYPKEGTNAQPNLALVG